MQLSSNWHAAVVKLPCSCCSLSAVIMLSYSCNQTVIKLSWSCHVSSSCQAVVFQLSCICYKTGNRFIKHVLEQEIDLLSMSCERKWYHIANNKTKTLAFSQTGNRIKWLFLKQEIELCSILSNRK